MPHPTRVLGYARVSSAEQALGSSLQDQQDVITRYAQGRGLKVAKHYVEAESGIRASEERREQMKALMSSVRAGDLVVCDKLDRWSRDPEFTYGSVRKILAVGAGFFAVGDNVDPSTSEGDTALGFRVLFAREEHKRIKQRLHGTANLLRAKGYYVGGLVPLGYCRPTNPQNRFDLNVLQVVPDEADLVREIFKRYVGGESAAKVARAMGLKVCHVQSCLRRRTYIGLVQGPPTAPGRKDGEWLRGGHEPIVDAAIFHRAQAVAAERRLGGPRPREAPSETSGWLLRDVARCALCRAKLGAAYGSRYGGRFPRCYYYRCSASCTSRYVPLRQEDHARAAVLDRLLALKSDLSTAWKVPPAAKVSSVEGRLAKLAARRGRYLEAHAAGLTTLAEVRAALGKLDTQRMALDAEAADEERPSRLSDPRVRVATLAQITSLAHAWHHASPERQREVATLICTTASLAAGQDPTYVWRSIDELAEDCE